MSQEANPAADGAADSAADFAEEAMILDEQDELAGYRRHFELPAGVYYFDGNSLGPLTQSSRQRVAQVVEQEWGREMVSAWNTAGWIDLAEHTGSKIARLVGARPEEVLVTDSTSINLFKLLGCALELRPGRRTILCQEEHFPSDLYMAQGLVDLRGQGFEMRLVKTADLPAALGENVAVMCCSHVDFKTGELYDMAGLNAEARRHGVLSCWDLAHSAGALPVELNATGTDLAVGCGYKFLNGGPGAPAFLYVAAAHHNNMRNPLPGWLGHRDPFVFETTYDPAPGMKRFHCGTTPILALASLDAALEVFADLDLDRLRRKSVALSEFFLKLLAQMDGTDEIEVVSPREASRRGSQISLRHPQAYALVQALIENQVIADFREPDRMRFGITPLYQRFLDVFYAVMTLSHLITEGTYREERFQVRNKVT